MSENLKQTGRVEAFSDGVFAIAITLLILEIRVPPHDETKGTGLVEPLAHLWPSYFAFFMSFAVILVMWVNHHRIFSYVERVDDAFLDWNGLLLLLVTAVPFPTALLAEYLTEGPDARVAAAVYSGMGLAIALAFTALWRHAVRDHRLLAPGCEAEVAELSRRYRYGPLAYLLTFGLAFVSAWASVGVSLALVLFYAFRGFLGKK